MGAAYKVRHHFTKAFNGMSIAVSHGNAALTVHRLRSMPGVVSVTEAKPLPRPAAISIVQHKSYQTKDSFANVMTGAVLVGYSPLHPAGPWPSCRAACNAPPDLSLCPFCL